MHLVLCSDSKTPKDSLRVGGVATQMTELTRALLALNHKVTLIFPSDQSFTKIFSDSYKIVGIKVPNGNFAFVEYNRSLSTRLKSMLANDGVDAIEFENLTGLYSFFTKKLSNVPVWSRCHGLNDLMIANQTLSGKLKKTLFFQDFTAFRFMSYLCYQLSPYIIANSNNTDKLLEKNFLINEHKIRVIYSGVNRLIFNEKVDGRSTRVQMGFENKIVFLYVGDFSYLKGILHLLYAFKKVIKLNPHFFLLLVGGYTVESRNYIFDIIRKLNLEKHTKVISYVPHETLPLYYALSDVCVVPSLCESFGFVALEALASGKPVIAYRTGGLVEIVTNKVGLLVNTGDIEGLARALCLLGLNRNIRIELGKNAVHRSFEFSWQKTAIQTINMAKSLSR